MVTRTAIFAVILALLTAGLSSAQTRITADLQPKKISMYENATLVISVESDKQDVPQPQLPPLTDFQVFSSGRTQRVNIVNGKASSSVVYTYVLVPRKPGRFSVGPASVIVDGQTYTSAVEHIVVNDAGAPPSRPDRSMDGATPGRTQRDAHHVFITASLDKDTVYVNEPVTYIFRFYNGERLLSNPEYERPSFTGFWVEDLPPQRKFSTTVNGIPYEVTEIRTALFPADAGTRTIPAAEVTATVRSRRRQQGRPNPFNLFDDTFFDRGEPLKLTSEALQLVVLHPPVTNIKPAHSGLVGEFQLKARADQIQVNVGDPITVSVTISGTGNIKSIPRPYHDTIPNFRMFAGGSSEKVSTVDYKISGWKSFDEVFVPQRAGTYKLPSFALTYLDPVTREFTTTRTDPIEVIVTGGAADFTIPSLKLDPDQLSDLAADVRFLKTDGGELRRASGAGLFGPAFWVGHVLPLLGLAGFVTWRRRVLNENADPVGRRRQLARQRAIARLRNSDGKTYNSLSYQDLSAALEQFYADRYNTHPQGQTRGEIRHSLKHDGIADDAIDAYIDLLDLCDRGRYAPGSVAEIDSEVISRAERTITAMGEKK